MRITYEEGDIAVVTTRSGKKYVGIYTHAPGIDYFWAPAIPGTAPNAMTDPDIAFEYLGSK